MVSAISGGQWFEGDVSCSVVRRVALPDAFLAIDGLFETFLTVLDDFAVFPAVIERELERHLPFLATTRVLTAAVAAGVGREVAHEVVKEHSLAVAGAQREGREDDLFARLAEDPRLPLDAAELAEILRSARGLTGTSSAQIDRFVERVAIVGAQYPAASAYRPQAIL
jgi:adenylosuccinate lyase